MRSTDSRHEPKLMGPNPTGRLGVPIRHLLLNYFFLIAYAWRETQTQRFINRELNQKIEAFITLGDLANCQSLLKSSNNVLARALSYGLQQLEKDHKKRRTVYSIAWM